MNKLKILTVVAAAAMLSSCDLSQIPGVSGKLSVEDSKAVGAACRHSGRALEDCFTLNPNTTQAGVFEGWREMNDYMLANKIDVVKPEIQASAFKADKPEAEPGKDDAHAPAEKHKSTPEKSDAANPPASGRERWTPKGASAADPSRKPEGGNAPPAEAALAPRTGKPDESAREEPAAEPPSRPWERKKDPKKHT